MITFGGWFVNFKPRLWLGKGIKTLSERERERGGEEQKEIQAEREKEKG